MSQSSRPPRPEGGPPGRPQIEAMAAYVLFRAAQAAAGNGTLRSAAYDRLVAGLTRRVEELWAKMFQAEEPEALGWVLERLGLLVSEGVLGEAEAARVRQALSARAGKPSRRSFGALAMLWRLHVMYRELLAAMERKELGEQSLPAVRAALHEQAMRVVTDALAGQPGRGATTGEALEELGTRLLEQDAPAASLSAREVRSLRKQLKAEIPDRHAGARCGVCGEAFSGSKPSVTCGSCDAPHHRECWEYNEGCAIFGCACQTLTEGAKGPVRFDLSRGRSKKLQAGPGPQEDTVRESRSKLPALAGLVVVASVGACSLPGGAAWLSAAAFVLLVGYAAYSAARLIDLKRRQGYGLERLAGDPRESLDSLTWKLAKLCLFLAITSSVAWAIDLGLHLGPRFQQPKIGLLPPIAALSFLLFGAPAFAAATMTALALRFERPSFFLELLVWAAAGIVGFVCGWLDVLMKFALLSGWHD